MLLKLNINNRDKEKEVMKDFHQEETLTPTRHKN
jgi:hypothetical protein